MAVAVAVEVGEQLRPGRSWTFFTIRASLRSWILVAGRGSCP